MHGWGGSYFRTREGFPVRYRDTNIRTLFTRGPCVHRVYQLTAASLFTWSVIPSIARIPVISEVAASRTRASSAGTREEFPRWFPTMSIDRTPRLSLRLLYSVFPSQLSIDSVLTVLTVSWRARRVTRPIDPCPNTFIRSRCFASFERRGIIVDEGNVCHERCMRIWMHVDMDKGQARIGMKRVRWRKVEERKEEREE